jgi:uncharacterized membrane protein
MKKQEFLGSYWPLIQAIATSYCVSLLLFLGRVFATDSLRYWFLIWNLALGWVPVALAAMLVRGLAKKRWLTGWNIVYTVLWLGFLPNSFYILSDMMHIHSTGEIGQLYDVVMFASFVFNGFVTGFISLYMVHSQLLKRFKDFHAHLVVAAVVLASGFAIYLGRNLRWNTWDIVVHPFAVLFDISDRIINPTTHPQAFVTTATFSMLIGSMYIVIWQFVKVVKHGK